MNQIAEFSQVFDAPRSQSGTRNKLAQRTLKTAIGCAGVGLHSGQPVHMTLKPAAPDTGIVFRRTDKGCDIPARFDHVIDTRLCTMIGTKDGVRVGTIEHLMAAFAGLRIDNCVVDIDGDEVPVMDGSAAPFLFLMECAGIVEQDADRQVIDILRPVKVEDPTSGAVAELLPGPGFSVDFDITFDSAAIGHQHLALDLHDGVFGADIARARTFGFLHEVEALRKAGLARGGSMNNAVVLSGDDVLNDEGLRYDNEFVRHKILDSIGDLYTAGHQIRGHLRASKSGHALNNRLLKALFDDHDAWRVETIRAADWGASCPPSRLAIA